VSAPKRIVLTNYGPSQSVTEKPGGRLLASWNGYKNEWTRHDGGDVAKMDELLARVDERACCND
jgi:hypothetical protein